MEEKSKGGCPRKIESPEKLAEYFVSYVKHERDNPILVDDYVGKDAIPVTRKKYVALTMEGFNCWLFERGIIASIKDYITNKDGIYNEFSDIVTHIRAYIFHNNFKGASVNELNANLIARQLGIRDTVDTDITTQGEKINTPGVFKVEVVQPSKDE